MSCLLCCELIELPLFLSSNSLFCVILLVFEITKSAYLVAFWSIIGIITVNFIVFEAYAITIILSLQIFAVFILLEG